MANMIVFVMVIITILFFIKIGMGSKKYKNSKNTNSSLDNLSNEEKRNRYINEINFLIEKYGISETTAF